MRARLLLHVRPYRYTERGDLLTLCSRSGGRRLACPAGTYGATVALRSISCTGPCPAGFYCPLATADPVDCGSEDRYCPIGSTSPLAVPPGHYSVGASVRRRHSTRVCPRSFYCVHGRQLPCPAGTYGTTTALATAQCTAPCPSGHYCPRQTTTPIKCPAGTFGKKIGLSEASCSGLCRSGYYCPAGSISATAIPCGTGAFCPTGTGHSTQPNPGAYVINGDSKLSTKAVVCPLGSYCSAHNGQATLCPGGTFGNAISLASEACSGLCAAGYYCPPGSSSATQFECGDVSLFCPQGSPRPVPVAVGFYTTGSESRVNTDQLAQDARTRSGQQLCEPGHFCVNGVRFKCPAGTFGNRSGLTSSSCSGLCRAGFYCPVGSIVATAFRCGRSNFYCPEGSELPFIAAKGYCTFADSSAFFSGLSLELIRVDQRQAAPGEFAWSGNCFPCPVGTYGSSSGETNARCSGACAAGFYCPSGSASSTQNECGAASVFCPSGSAAPVAVSNGFYTSKSSDECPPGMFRDLSTSQSNYVDSLTGTSPIAVNYGDFLFPLAACVLCPHGTFKPSPGDDLAMCQPCPQWTTKSSSDGRSCLCFRRDGGLAWNPSTNYHLFFNIDTMQCDLKPNSALVLEAVANAKASPSRFTRSQQFPCEKGFFCLNGLRSPCPAGYYGDAVMETRSLCTAVCAPGYYCPLASTSSQQLRCGGPHVYCPPGSAIPKPVTPGYYTVRLANLTLRSQSDTTAGTLAIRDAQVACEPGYYCVGGQRFICPAGRYGDLTMEQSPACAGNCLRGFYCPPGSTAATQIQCGSDQYICRTGSGLPELVAPGYYSVGGTNSTRYHQLPCEPGYYCARDGMKRQCPHGTYGATSGLQTSQCSGLCTAGYYCPSYPFPPSTSSTQVACGNSTVYCPTGTGNKPMLVQSGFYSTGAGDGSGDVLNTTRTGQKICPKGFYCRRGIVIRCPDGTYGDKEGLTSMFCQGWCPPGRCSGPTATLTSPD